MIVQEPLTKRLAHRSLLYAILGDEMRSETLRLMIRWLNHQSADSDGAPEKQNEAVAHSTRQK